MFSPLILNSEGNRHPSALPFGNYNARQRKKKHFSMINTESQSERRTFRTDLHTGKSRGEDGVRETERHTSPLREFCQVLAHPAGIPKRSCNTQSKNSASCVLVREIFESLACPSMLTGKQALDYITQVVLPSYSVVLPHLLCVRNEIVQKHRIPNGIQQDDISNY